MLCLGWFNRYVAEDTPNVSYLNCHHIISNLRDEAKQKGGQGPRVVVAGPTDAGKSTLSRMLLNWAVRGQHRPTYVDLDIGGCSCSRCPKCDVFAMQQVSQFARNCMMRSTTI